MSIKRFHQFHARQDMHLLRVLAGIVDVTGSPEADVGDTYAKDACDEANAKVATDDVEDASDFG